MSFFSDHCRACRPNLSGGISSAASNKVWSLSTTSGPTFSAALARALAWLVVMSPVANLSLTLGMSESCLAILAIRLDSRPGSFPPWRSASAGSVSVSAASSISATSHMSDAATDWMLVSVPSVSSASAWDIGRMRACCNSARAAATWGSAPPSGWVAGSGLPLLQVADSWKRANVCSLSMVVVIP